MSASVLIVEDQASAAEYLRLLLDQEGYVPQIARDGVEAMVALERERYDLVITDVKMPNMNGIELLARVKERWREIPVIVLTVDAEVSEIVEAVQLGATNYLVKPAAPPAVLSAVQKALAGAARQEPVPDSTGPVLELVGRSRAIVDVRHKIAMAAQSDVPVLITGKTGTGKELVAREIHASSRLAGPFVAHNCAVSPADLFDSELFGHRRGAFTGANRDHVGLLQQADRGVLLLDELEELPVAHQAKLLRVLDDGEVRPVGAEHSARVSVRFLAAMNVDPLAMLEQGKLREDLYYRLRGFEIKLPQLAERREDIPLLVEHFLREGPEGEGTQAEGELGKAAPGERAPSIGSEALRALQHAAWPGHVRQLRNVVLSARAQAGDAAIGMRHLSLDSSEDAYAPKHDDTSAPRGATLKRVEHRAILQALEDAGGNRTRAAELLGINRSTLRRKLREYGEHADVASPGS
jgi:DNA-binding NtrC family response regulator